MRSGVRCSWEKGETMGLFGAGKSEEEKYQERVAKALDEMGLTIESVGQSDGMLHVGCFQGASSTTSYGTMSQTIEGVLKILQTQGREIVDVKVGPCGVDTLPGQLVTILYR